MQRPARNTTRTSGEPSPPLASSVAPLLRGKDSLQLDVLDSETKFTSHEIETCESMLLRLWSLSLVRANSHLSLGAADS